MIIISGISDQDHAQGLIKLGAFDYLLKPFRLEVVEKSVMRAVEHRRRLQEGTTLDGNEVQAATADDPTDWKIV